MEGQKKKYTKVGAVLKGQKGNSFVVLGNTKSRNEKYNYNVEVRVTDSQGNAVTELRNGILSVFDPRKRPNITEEEAQRIPESVLFELFIVE